MNLILVCFLKVNMKKNVAKEKDIYIDDEDFADGSGNGDTIESSGSGFGPPDEDGEHSRVELPGNIQCTACTNLFTIYLLLFGNLKIECLTKCYQVEYIYSVHTLILFFLSVYTILHRLSLRRYTILHKSKIVC